MLTHAASRSSTSACAISSPLPPAGTVVRTTTTSPTANHQSAITILVSQYCDPQRALNSIGGGATIDKQANGHRRENDRIASVVEVRAAADRGARRCVTA